MKLICTVFCMTLLFQLAGIYKSFAQQNADSVSHLKYYNFLRQVYMDGIADNAQIYHGIEYIRNGQKAIGYPFYGADNMQTGLVSYQGIVYPGKSLYYNLVSDELIIHNYAQNALIVLEPGKVDSFTVQEHAFVNLAATHSNGLAMNGYYEKIFPGEPALYARREKRLVTGSGNEESKYIQYDNYFVKYKNIFYPVDGKTGVLEILNDQKDALKKYIRSNNLNFKKDLEHSLLLTIIYYSQLKH